MSRMDRNKLNIGTYILRRYARTEQHIKDVADCGIDFVVSMEDDKTALDLFEKYGVGAIVARVVPSWWGGDGENAGTMAQRNPLSVYDTCGAKFVDHPAVWGIDIGDEPSALDFPHFGKIVDKVNRVFPNQFAYLNLYPNYASVAKNTEEETVNQLGTPSYEEHIAAYCRNVPTDYICYDFYLYEIGETWHYENLRIVADACLRTGRDMWIVLQMNKGGPEHWISTNKLRFQAYSSMAFGARSLIWANYTAGWFVNAILDKDGNKTEQYEKLKEMNRELRTIGPEYMKFRRVSTHFIGFDGYPDMERVHQNPIGKLDTGVFFDVHAEGGEPLLVGQMVSCNNDGSYALMVCAADDPMDLMEKEYNVVFRVSDRRISAIGGNGYIPVVKREDGSYAVTVRSNSGVLIAAR